MNIDIYSSMVKRLVNNELGSSVWSDTDLLANMLTG